MEYLDVCTEDGVPTGERIERSQAHTDGVCHRTAHVWIVKYENGRPQILLQKRSMNKDSFPGRFDTSSAGHIPAGDEPAQSAVRELREELGITASPEELEPIGSFRIKYEKEFHGKMFRDNEAANVFIYSKPVDIAALALQEEEVESVEWFDLEETLAAKERHEYKFCVPVESLRLLKSALENR